MPTNTMVIEIEIRATPCYSIWFNYMSMKMRWMELAQDIVTTTSSFFPIRSLWRKGLTQMISISTYEVCMQLCRCLPLPSAPSLQFFVMFALTFLSPFSCHSASTRVPLSTFSLSHHRFVLEITVSTDKMMLEAGASAYQRVNVLFKGLIRAF